MDPGFRRDDELRALLKVNRPARHHDTFRC